MSPGSFRALLFSFGCGLNSAGALLGVSRAQVARWDRGDAPIPPAVALALVLLAERRFKLGDPLPKTVEPGAPPAPGFSRARRRATRELMAEARA